jgi:hypothetical protein
MSNMGLFAMGILVTLLVAGSIGLLVWGAILDGRYQDERQEERDAPGPDSVAVAGSGRVVSKPFDTPRTIEVLATTTTAAGVGQRVTVPVTSGSAPRPLKRHE